jgi:hypothetical protein
MVHATAIPADEESALFSTAELQEPDWILTATWCFVGLGILVRLVRYLVNYPIWHDEAFLAVNFWDRDYVDLLRPLDYGQVAPWLFLAIERTAVLWLGYSERVLRLFPSVCSILSVPLFCLVSGQVVRGIPRLLAVAVFAVSFYPIRHGAEIKPYASDVLAALILLYLALRWIRAPQSSRSWWMLVGVTPLLVALSYPAVFVAGGISLAAAWTVLAANRRPVRLAWTIYNVVLTATFVAVYLACTVVQAKDMRLEYRFGIWADSFPPLERPWALPFWLLETHTGTMMAYPIGERHGGSAATLLGVVVGCLALYRRGRKRELGLLLAPFGLGLIAAGLGRYPYGGASRIMQYVAPSICLLLGIGLATLIARFCPLPRRRGALVVGLLCLFSLGVWMAARDLAKPYRVAEDLKTREFARWFWTEKAADAGVVCLKSDLGLPFRPALWKVGMSAVYLFHQRLFSDQNARRQASRLDPADFSTHRPLRLVAFDALPRDMPGFEAWISGLGRSFEIRRTDSYLIQPGKPGEDWLRDAYDVLELVPRTPARAIAVAPGRRSSLRD